MSKSVGALVAFCVFISACDQGPRGIPTGNFPTPVPAPPPPPQPRPFPPVEFTEITVGQAVNGIVPTSPPGCEGNPEWPCLYFHVKPPADGTLVAELNYKPETQPPGKFGIQSVDVSIVEQGGGEAWADFSTATTTRASITARAGVVYRVVLWYAYPNLEYELKTRLE
jgi:hypothetical protein